MKTNKVRLEVVSVDWDYFLPDIAWYDWGHSEAPFFLTHVWPLRAWNHHLKTMEGPAHKTVKCTGWRQFWNRAVCFDRLQAVCIAESHADIVWFLDQHVSNKKRVHYDIYNFDQHHDWSYNDDRTELECGNWVRYLHRRGRVDAYNLIYPAWRQGLEEWDGESPWGKEGLQEEAPFYGTGRKDGDRFIWRTVPHLLFICRSSAWTPPWCDDDWLKFIKRPIEEATARHVPTHARPEVITRRDWALPPEPPYYQDMMEALAKRKEGVS